MAGHGAVVVEPWLERVLDFSIQYDREEGARLKRRGLVVLENTSQGRFCGAMVAERFSQVTSS